MPKGNRLGGKSIFLSASVPSREPFSRNVPPDVVFEIAEAIGALASHIFAENGRLVFGGHPSITPIVAQTAREFFGQSDSLFVVPGPFGMQSLAPNLPKTLPVVVYQSGIYEPDFVPEVYALAGNDLMRTPIAELILTLPVENGLVIENLASDHARRLQADSEARNENLSTMRREMISRNDLVAMIAIGGMEGIHVEETLFRESHPDAPIFAIVGTGGATRDMQNAVKVDNEFLRTVLHLSDIPPTNAIAPIDSVEIPPMTPYGIVMAHLIDHLCHILEDGDQESSSS